MVPIAADAMTNQDHAISGLILAAGRARRMGGYQKVLAPLAGRLCLHWVLRALRAGGVEQIVVVSGYRALAVQRACAVYPGVRVVYNPDYAQGMGTSLSCGVRALAPYSRAVMIALGDMPLVSSEVVAQLIRVFANCDKSIIVPCHRQRRGHPVIFSARHFADLEKLRGDRGARALLQRHAQEILEVPVDQAGIWQDMDCAAQWRSLARLLSQ